MSAVIISSALERALLDTAAQVETVLDRLLPRPVDAEARLYQAMRHGALGGGKRLRPFFVLASSRLFGVADSCALRVAAAVECIHCYSLVHDDLPAMDDDVLRRGKPTVHVAFDEATAILAGDALQSLAFEILADADSHADPQVRCQLVTALARAAGGHGMAGGQMIDMLADRDSFDIGTITRLQRLKTGELFAFSCEAGAILGKADNARRQALHAFAHDLGLAFQITDDLLDIEGRPEDTGKSQGKDDRAGKATFVSILGPERARRQAGMLADQAIAHLDIFEERADILRDAARYVVTRRG